MEGDVKRSVTSSFFVQIYICSFLLVSVGRVQRVGVGGDQAAATIPEAIKYGSNHRTQPRARKGIHIIGERAKAKGSAQSQRRSTTANELGRSVSMVFIHAVVAIIIIVIIE